MATITNEMLYAEMLKIDKRLQDAVEELQDFASFMKETNKELAEGRAHTEALKKSLFGNRFGIVNAENV